MLVKEPNYIIGHLLKANKEHRKHSSCTCISKGNCSKPIRNIGNICHVHVSVKGISSLREWRAENNSPGEEGDIPEISGSRKPLSHLKGSSATRAHGQGLLGAPGPHPSMSYKSLS